MKFMDIRHPFFLPKRRRIVVVVLCLGWALMEVILGSSAIWPILFGGIGLYCAYEFFVIFDPENYREKTEDE